MCARFPILTSHPCRCLSFMLHPQTHYISNNQTHSSMEFDLENPLTAIQDFHLDTIPSPFLIESDHMPSPSYIKTLKAIDFDTSFRREVISSILQVSSNFDAFMPYLAVNYLDRFLSSQEMKQPKPWMVRLLAVSCVSLAAKMQKTEFSFNNIQGDGGFIFDAQTIQRMEVIMLGALKWRMRSITPFSFVPFFISLFKHKDPPLRQALKTRALEIIFRTQNDILLLEFKPSIIAASALLSASHELFPLQFSCFRKAILNCSYVNKDDMIQCYNAMQEITMEDYESVLDMMSSSNTPVNVLDRHAFSSESETNGTSIVTTTASSNRRWQERSLKRRKISGYCNNQRAQISQIQHC